MAKRRGNNEGSIYRRKDGRWVSQIMVGRDEEGKPKKRYVYGKTRREVQEQLKKLLVDQQQGIPIDPVKQTVGEFLTLWLEDSVKMSVRPKTYTSYKQTIDKQITPSLGKIQLAKLMPQHLQHFFHQEQEKGLTRTVTLCYAILHKSLGQAVKWGLIPRNIADLIDKPKVPKKEMMALSPEEAARFLNAAKSERLYALYVLAVTCGLRQGELLGLKWEDVNFGEGSLQVRRQLQWCQGKPEFREPKSAASRRLVSLPKMALAALREHKKNQAAERLSAGVVWQDWDLVFPSTVGTPLNPSNLRNYSFHRVLDNAGLPHIRFHDLRHTAATLLLSQGVHPKLVQEQLGHSQISLTLDTYSHVLPTMKKDVAVKMDEIFNNPQKKGNQKVGF